MNKLFGSIIIISLIILFTFCKNGNNDEQNEDALIESISSSEHLMSDPDIQEYTAYLVFSHDGKTDYISTTPTDEFLVTESGLEYRFVEHNKGNTSPKPGDIVILSMRYTDESDSTLFDSESVDENFRMRVTPPSHPGGSIEDAFMLMNKGDSAIFKIDAENFFIFTQKRVNIPDFITVGDQLTFYIRIKEVLSNEEFVLNHSDVYQHKLQQEKSLIERFLLNIEEFDIRRYQSGLIHIIIEQGQGKNVELGNSVTIDYIASFIDGAPFDSSLDRNEPFEFVVGENQVIEGLEKAVLNMNVGEYSLVIIPFKLGYGEERTGMIPPFSTLVFEIELLNAE